MLLTDGIINMGSAMLRLTGTIEPTLAPVPILSLDDSLELAMMSVTILAALVAERRMTGVLSDRRATVSALLLTLGELTLYGFIHVFAFPLALATAGLLTDFGLAAVTLSATIGSSYCLLQSTGSSPRWEETYLLTGVLLIGGSALAATGDFLIPVSILELSMLLRAFALFAFNVSFGIPVQTELGISRRAAGAYAFSLCFLPYVPYVIANVTVLVPLPLLGANTGVYSLSHLVAALLSASCALLQYMNVKELGVPGGLPLVSIFATWTVLELALLSTAGGTILLGENITIYVFGNLVTLVWLLALISGGGRLRKAPGPSHTVSWLLVYLGAILGAAVFLSWSFWAGWISPSLGLALCALLLVTSYATLPCLTLLVLIFLKAGTRMISLEVLSSGFLTLWSYTGILRGSFAEWTAGWWSAEFLLVVSLPLAPVVMGMVYTQLLHEEKELKTRATLYGDILVHDLKNYHQVLLTSLELIGLPDMPAKTKETTRLEALASLDHADQLIKNVRALDKSTRLGASQLAPTDLATVILDAWQQAWAASNKPQAAFSLNRHPGDCVVMAAPLLGEVFLNLFRNAIEYSSKQKSVTVEISKQKSGNRNLWVTRVADMGKGIPPEVKAQLFQRNFQSAKGMGLGLWVARAITEGFGGQLTIEDRVPGDYTQGTVFIVALRAVVPSPSAKQY
jgi:signal transduction histidine kinase